MATGLMTIALVASAAVAALGLWPLLLLTLGDPLLRLRRRTLRPVVDAAE